MEFESIILIRGWGIRKKLREKIIDLIKEDDIITTHELAEALEITSKGIEWQIQKLKKEGALKRIGAKKGGRWEML